MARNIWVWGGRHRVQIGSHCVVCRFVPLVDVVVVVVVVVSEQALVGCPCIV